MNEYDRELTEDLRGLARDESCAPPSHLEQRVVAEFRKTMVLRRRKVWFQWAPVGAVAAGLMVWLWMPGNIATQSSRPAPTEVAIANAESSALPADAITDPEDGFYPLPEADALPPVENAMVVRVEMPPSSLRMMGFSVEEESGDAVEADVLLGQDGLARGVRLVQ